MSKLKISLLTRIICNHQIKINITNHFINFEASIRIDTFQYCWVLHFKSARHFYDRSVTFQVATMNWTASNCQVQMRSLLFQHRKNFADPH